MYRSINCFVPDKAVRAPVDAPSTPSPAAAPLPASPALAMQEWELPRRYQRQILSDEEMDAINVSVFFFKRYIFFYQLKCMLYSIRNGRNQHEC